MNGSGPVGKDSSTGVFARFPLPDGLCSEMPTHSRVEYGQLATAGVLLGLAMFVVGATGELAIQVHLLQVPAWEETVFFTLELLGIPLFLLSPFVFRIALPLIGDSGWRRFYGG